MNNNGNIYGDFIYNNLKYYGDISIFFLFGFILCFAYYLCMVYWKEYIITFYKHKYYPNEGYIEVLHDLKKRKKNMGYFTAMLSALLYVILDIIKKKGNFLYPGLIGFVTCILSYNFYQYVYLKERFDVFDDFVFIYNYITKKGRPKIKKD